MGPARRRLTAGLLGVTLDIGALRESSAFRRLSAGQLVSLIGRQITVVAVPYQVYRLTGSVATVGLLGLAQAIPLITVSLAAGGLADRFDRRRLLLVTQVLLAACSAALLVGALGRPPVALIFVIVAVAAAISALDTPTRTAIVPNIVPPSRLAGAISLNFAMFHTALIAGPALAGLVIARLGLAGAYLIDVASFSVAVLAVWLLPPQAPPRGRTEAPIAAVRRGLAFIRHQRVILGGYAMDLSAMVFGLPRALFPALAAATYHTDVQGLGFLYAAPGVGALIAALLSGAVSRSRRLGRVVVVMIAVWGLAIIAFGVVTTLWVGLVLLAVAGAADSLSAVARSTITQTLTPDELRGRVSSTYSMVVVGGPYLGDVEAGVLAGATSSQFSVISGGALCLLGLGVASLRFPEVWRYRARQFTAAPSLPDDALATPPV